ncbi:hypothetical protein AB0C12_35685 [Actinoplanes sp. NPDC048967]|uniref:hypothetical protein n=1 Tax=Actinoplanes sp. NPDC048967 TaxID=3155269 RepID=UPI0033F392BD
MSWSLYAVPLHDLAEDGMADWAKSTSFSRGVPDQAPPPRPLPSVGDVLRAFRTAGCHGTPWFIVDATGAAEQLEECPDPSACPRTDGRDLGEVSLRAEDHADRDRPLPLDAAVRSLSFRKPDGTAVLAAMCALTPVAGAQLVYDDSADEVFVVRSGERAEDLVADWPW